MDEVKLQAGRDLDDLIAKMVFGITTYQVEKSGMVFAVGRIWLDIGDYYYYRHDNAVVPHALPHYSTDIAAAWEIVEKLKLTVWPMQDGRWFAFREPVNPTYGHEQWLGGSEFPNLYGELIADTAPHAICLAALETMRKRR